MSKHVSSSCHGTNLGELVDDSNWWTMKTVGLRSPKQNELHCADRFFPRWAKTTRATRDDPMTASLPWVTSCSCVVVVCVLELLSATSSWAKATKTERQERHDEVCMQETASVMSALHSVAAAQLSPASRPRARPAPGRKCVCGIQQADRRK